MSQLEPQVYSQGSPALVQKYLAVMDLSSGEASESTDQTALLAALIERIKGVAQVLTSLSGVGKPPSHTDQLAVSDLYTWYGHL